MFTHLLVHFFGGQLPSGTHVIGGELVLRHAGWFGWLLLLGITLWAGVAFAYHRAGQPLSTRRRWTLSILRMALILLILLMLLDPVLVLNVQGQIRRSMLFLLDGTQSMGITDARSTDADIKRAMIAMGQLDPAGGLKQPAKIPASPPNPSRLELLKAVLRNPRLDLLGKFSASYDVRPFFFGQSLREPAAPEQPDPAPQQRLEWVDQLRADDSSTAIGDSMRDLLARSRGQPLAGIFLATDGQNNAGSNPLIAAGQARADNVPLFIYGLGISDPKDIVVSSVYAPDVCFVRDDVPVTVRVRGLGLVGETGHIELRLGNDVVDRKDVVFDGSEQAVMMKITPTTAGQVQLTASIAPRPDEVVKENNSAKTSIRVIDGKIKVLLVDSAPRWETKYLQAMLLRDRRVEAKFLIQQADPGLSQDPQSPYLAAFPATRPELFDHFDLVIFGDVDPTSLSSGEIDSITEFVGKFGGGLLLMPGKRFGVEALAASPLSKLAPVDFSTAQPIVGTKPIQLLLTSAGERATMLRLSDDPAESRSLWARLPPIYSDIIARAKPAAEVLVTQVGAAVVTDPANRTATLAVQQYGSGQVMYLGTDNLWRWRKNIGDQYYVALWGQMIQRMALPHLLGESKRTQLSTDKKSYATGDRVTVFARLYDQGFTPLTDPEARGTYSVAGRSAAVLLRPLPDEPGMYRGEFIAPSPGDFEFSMDRDPKTSLAFSVTQARLELSQSAMDEPMLRQLAASTGGVFYREEDLYKLPGDIGQKNDTIRSTLQIDLWSTPLVLGLMLALATAEWILRKLSQLK